MDALITQVTHFYLHRLHDIVQKIAQHSSAHSEVLNYRLAPDMLPFFSQVQITCNFALRIACPLANVAVVNFSEQGDSFANVFQQIQRTMDYLEKLEINAQTIPETITDTLGFAEVRLPAEQYIYAVALPNFYFHLSSVYLIGRHLGVPLSKGDFDGMHNYPSGFRFDPNN